MEMEIDFLQKNVLEKNPKLLTDYIRSMASGDSPCFPTVLSLVYDGLVGKTFPKQHTFTLGSNSFPGAQSVTTPTPLHTSSWTSAAALPFTFDLSSSFTPTVAGSSRTVVERQELKCARCRGKARLGQLYGGLHCPWCSEDGKNGEGVKGRPYMRCCGCTHLRTTRTKRCVPCDAKFL
ncbi:hypothetical protein BJ322DRAFT_346861 [Thelephora terrestris]|uniref:Uncharacterized protein n=1 Tax=Thelephora terrestris TaxID=56493 RepID=A0A9P6H5G7_9AGAM|nr:hypothetical protein BJ322DRAFT_346861 [Thelephora terrestris]